MEAHFRHAPLMHTDYKRRIGEEGEDVTHVMTREDRINFNYVPLEEVVRAVCSIYKSNFKISDDRYSFCNLVKKILRNSSKFIVSTQEFDLGYADIDFDCLTKKLFPLWKQIASKWEPKEDQPQGENENNLEFEYGYGYDWDNQNIFGEFIFLEGEIEGMETYHRVTIEMVQLNKEDEGSIKDHEKAGT